MDKEKQSRTIALDIIRIFAFFCVVSVHFFACSGYYEEILLGKRLYVATLIRSFFMICVPLFLLLSGYLMRHKKATKEYYKKLIRILGEYLLASLFCMAFYAISDVGFSFDALRVFLLQIPGIFSFEAAPYSWYVSMYIGLFLLIPFLNILYNGLKSQKEKRLLILTMLLLSGIPDILNSVHITLPWTMIYNDPANVMCILPDWWSGFYPVTYYFIGAYLSEYPLQLPKIKSIIFIVLSNILVGSISFFICRGTTFIWGSWSSHQSLFVVTQAVLVFDLLMQIDVRRIGPQGQKFLSTLSYLSFSAYLVSSNFDSLFYYRIRWIFDWINNNVLLFLVMVPLVFVCSFITSFVLVSIYKLLTKATQYIISHRTRQAC